jgi:hypothetical protein
MAIQWVLSGEAGKAFGPTGYTLEALNAQRTRIKFINLGVDTLTYSIELESLSSSTTGVPELGQKVHLYRSGVLTFHGHVTGKRQSGRTIAITVSGPWWWLERIFLENPEVDDAGTTAQRPTIAFPAQNLETSLLTILNKAIALGVPFSVDYLRPTFPSPPMRVNQMSYAGVIADLVRVTPDMVLYFDYSSVPARLATNRRRNVPVLTIEAGNCSNFNLSPITELEVTQVKVPYMTRNNVGQKTYSRQTAGTPALGKVYIHLVSGAEMATFLPPDVIKTVITTGQALKIKVKTEATAASIGDSVAKNFDPVLSEINKKFKPGDFGSITCPGVWIGDYSTPRRLTAGPASTAKNSGGKTFNPSTNRFILLSSSLPAWAATQLQAERVTYSGTWYYFHGPEYQSESPPVLNPLEEALAAGALETGFYWVVKPTKGLDPRFIPSLDIRIRRYIKRSWSATVTVINRASGTVTQTNEPTATTTADYAFRYPPEGYAQGLLEAQNYIPYEGSFTIVEDDAGGGHFRYCGINFSGSQPEHASIVAMVSEVEVDIATAKTTVRLGPPARFSYKELVNRVRTNPNEQITYL